MTYNTFDLVELGQAESSIELNRHINDSEVSFTWSTSLYASYADLGEAEDVVEYLGAPIDTEVGGAYSKPMYAYYEDSNE